MNKTIPIILPLLLLAGCGNPGASADGNAATAQTEPKIGSGEGTVTAIDADTGKITLTHGPVTELHWPAMTMGFATKGGQVDGLKVGDRVKFRFRWDGKTGEIESIERK